eukprot:6621384-Pyramimonas_sp.AAC.1
MWHLDKAGFACRLRVLHGREGASQRYLKRERVVLHYKPLPFSQLADVAESDLQVTAWACIS